jgi:hypothetical protein
VHASTGQDLADVTVAVRDFKMRRLSSDAHTELLETF